MWPLKAFLAVCLQLAFISAFLTTAIFAQPDLYSSKSRINSDFGLIEAPVQWKTACDQCWVDKYGTLSVSVVNLASQQPTRKNWLSTHWIIFLLLSGDISPNPGPEPMPVFDCFDQKGMHFLHVNARSILPKIDEIRHLAKKTNCAVLGVTETWLDNSVNNAEINIEGYLLERNDRNREGGGVCVYVRSNLAYNRRTDIGCDLETVFVDLLLPKTKAILFGTVYRTPTCDNFYEKLEDSIVNSPNFFNQECYILGDFNTDVLSKNKNSTLVKKLKSFCNVFNMKQLVQDHTRITDSSSTAIDLILTTDEDKVTQSGVLPYGVSDHQVIFCT